MRFDDLIPIRRVSGYMGVSGTMPGSHAELQYPATVLLNVEYILLNAVQRNLKVTSHVMLK